MAQPFSEILEQLAQRQNLDDDQAAAAFAMLLSGELTPAQSGAMLMGLRAKGETAREVAAAVNAALAEARMVTGLEGIRIDTCGTGGDHSNSFNCSTTVALYLAALGYPVVKHGNRSLTSFSGSADIVEALGLPMHDNPDDVTRTLQEETFTFLFAPHFHPAFKHIMPVRKDMAIRTLFNLLGPLLNPGRPTHQLLGVARPQVLDLMAEVLQLTGVQRAVVVCGSGGSSGGRFDEFTTFGPAEVVWVGGEQLVHTELDPYEFGFPRHAPGDVAVHSKEEAVDAVKNLLSGKGPQAMQDMVALNLGVALHILEEGLGLSESFDKARAAVAQGAAARYAG
ncbi:anthranilate phosphoribosyltransferase [Oceanidesulfovibrio indonesiensis]|uniref:Anthranilate phosphoribosyltransferase n=1 Tax=Oceanidesulfovibrio indonesiensis TaxID=54767 RepID=A0A7M3MFX2_9BACT|nr:anthranilate phosphoribosyltransferase [Oceanidesulfovibrio indonesiensis]TVM17648.1 anthranilate phosphoribosyltransferase [Oceanidesulfovibrio indonesiensis]